MADLDQLERALRNADAAGDTAAARQLAQAIMAQRGAARPAQQDTPNPFVGALYGAGRAARDVIDAPALWLAKGADALGLTSGEAQRVSDINKRAEQEYQAATPGSVSAGTMRALGNVASAFIPGTGQVGAAKKAADLWQTEKMLGRLGALGTAAGLGAAQNTVLGTRTLDDSALEQAATGAAFGAGGQLVGAGLSAGVQGLRNLRAGSQGTAGRVLSSAAEMTPEDLMARIRAGSGELVPGSIPTTTQSAMVPGISRLQAGMRTLAPNDFAAVQEAQNAARLQALDRVAPGAAGMTSQGAADNLGRVAAEERGAWKGMLKDVERAKYKEAMDSGATLLLPDERAINQVLKDFYPKGPIPGDGHASVLHAFAEQLKSGEPVTLAEFDALRKTAGNKNRALSRSTGEGDPQAAAAWGAMKGLLNDAEQAAIAKSDRLAPTGQGPWGPVYSGLAGDPENAVAHLLRTGNGSVPGAGMHPIMGPIELVAGEPIGKGGIGVLHVQARGRDDALRRLPYLLTGGDAYGRVEGKMLKPKGGERGQFFVGDADYEAVVKSEYRPPGGGDAIDRTWSPTVYKISPDRGVAPVASKSAYGTDTLAGPVGFPPGTGASVSLPDIAAAFRAFDQSVNPPAPLRDPRAYSGDLAGALLPEQAAPLRAGRAMHAEIQNRFNNGPWAYADRIGSDGLPMAQGAELARRFVHGGSSQGDDIARLKGAVLERGPTMQAARDYAMADLLQSAVGRETGLLSPSKTGAWMDRRSGLLAGLLDEPQRGLLGGVRDDLERAAKAERLGQGSGSNTAEKLMSLGLLDSPWIDRGARLVPGWLGGDVARAALGAVRDSGRRSVAKDTAETLIDKAKALEALRVYQNLLDPTSLQRGLLWGMPLGAAPVFAD